MASQSLILTCESLIWVKHFRFKDSFNLKSQIIVSFNFKFLTDCISQEIIKVETQVGRFKISDFIRKLIWFQNQYFGRPWVCFLSSSPYRWPDLAPGGLPASSSSVVSSLCGCDRRLISAPEHFCLYIKAEKRKPRPVFDLLHACKEWFIIFFKKDVCTVDELLRLFFFFFYVVFGERRL